MASATSKEASLIARKFSALAFLPVDQIRSKAEGMIASLPVNYVSFGPYFYEQWLQVVPPENWCVYRQATRINNQVRVKKI